MPHSDLTHITFNSLLSQLRKPNTKPSLCPYFFPSIPENMKRQREFNDGKESLDLANCLMLLSQTPAENKTAQQISSDSSATQLFECKTCNRKFSSFQALGGHRASHKRPKIDSEDLKGQAKSLSLGNKPKMHECSICGLEFSLGQALGGHMRRHRAAMNMELGFSNSVKQQEATAKVPVLKRSNSKRIMSLDLNLTPLENDLKLLFGNMAPKVQLSMV